MARTALTPQVGSKTPAAVTYAAANADGHSVPLNAHMGIIVKNGSGGSINVTIDSTFVGQAGGALPDNTFAVPAGADRLFTLSSKDARQSGNVAHIDFSAVTTVTVAVIQL